MTDNGHRTTLKAPFQHIVLKWANKMCFWDTNAPLNGHFLTSVSKKKNTHVKYESSITCNSNISANLKVFAEKRTYSRCRNYNARPSINERAEKRGIAPQSGYLNRWMKAPLTKEQWAYGLWINFLNGVSCLFQHYFSHITVEAQIFMYFKCTRLEFWYILHINIPIYDSLDPMGLELGTSRSRVQDPTTELLRTHPAWPVKLKILGNEYKWIQALSFFNNVFKWFLLSKHKIVWKRFKIDAKRNLLVKLLRSD